VDISGIVAFDGEFSVDGTAAFTDASFDGTVDFGDGVAFGAEVSIGGTLKVDGTSDFFDEVDFSAVNILGVCAIFGDWSTNSQDVTYTASTDGIVCAFTPIPVAGIRNLNGVTPAGTPRITDHVSAGNTMDLNITMPVRKGDTWAAETDPTTTTITVYWLAIGANT